MSWSEHDDEETTAVRYAPGAKRLVYLACPLSSERGETVEGNIMRAKRIYRRLCLAHPDVVFLTQWIVNCEVFEDTPEFRAAGMERNKAIISLLHKVKGELWLAGPRVSPGMSAEALWASELGVEIVNLVDREVSGR